MIRFALIGLFITVGLGQAAATDFPCAKFDKSADGSWAAKEPVEIFGPNGRLDFTPGETYRQGDQKAGFDIAKLLDANCAKR